MKRLYRQTTDRLSRLLKTDTDYIARGSFWIFLFRGFAALFGFFSTLALTHFLPKAAFGEYRYILSIAALVTIFSLPGIDAAVTRAAARLERFSLPATFRAKALWGLLSTVVALGIAGYYFLNGNMMLARGFAAISVFLPFVESFFVYTSHYRGVKDFKRFSLFQVISQFLQTAAVIVAVAVSQNIIIVLAALFAGQTVPRWFFYKRACRDAAQQIELQEEDTTKEVVQYGKKLSLTHIVTRLSNQIDSLLIWQFFGAALLAVYTVALVTPNAVRGVTDSLSALALPKLSQWDWNNYAQKKVFARKMVLFAVFLTASYIAFVLIVPHFLRWFFPEYLDALTPTIILGLLIVLAPLRNMLDQLFIAAQRVRGIFWYRVFEVVVYVGVFVTLFLIDVQPFLVVSVTLVAKFLLTIIIQISMIATWKR